jgi:NTE family protein
MSKKVNLALQGGGSHGAFTWGVLDRILEDDDITLDGISGTSAGAMNAAVLAHGYAKGGREGAREHLGTFWREVSKSAQWSIFRRSMHDRFTGNWNIDGSPTVMMADLVKTAISPYTMNPNGYSPLRIALAKSIDIETIKDSPIHIFI